MIANYFMNNILNSYSHDSGSHRWYVKFFVNIVIGSGGGLMQAPSHYLNTGLILGLRPANE